jgi:hypothetical protein
MLSWPFFSAHNFTFGSASTWNLNTGDIRSTILGGSLLIDSFSTAAPYLSTVLLIPYDNTYYTSKGTAAPYISTVLLIPYDNACHTSKQHTSYRYCHVGIKTYLLTSRFEHSENRRRTYCL